MNSKSKTWLQLYVDAMTERDPYKRLALVKELRNTPRDLADELGEESASSSRKSKLVRRH